MTTVTGKNGCKYEVRDRLYGTSNLVHRLYLGGVYLACTGSQGLNVPSLSIEDAIAKADKRAESLGLAVKD